MAFSVTIKRWHAVAAWTWNAGDDVCGICHTHYDGCPPDCKYPGDDSPVVWGACGHAFHIQCIQKWLASSNEQRCPMCRRGWEYKNAGTQEGEEGQQQQQGMANDAQEQQGRQQQQEQQEEQLPEEGTPQEERMQSDGTHSRGSSARHTLEYEEEDEDMQMGEGDG